MSHLVLLLQGERTVCGKVYDSQRGRKGVRGGNMIDFMSTQRMGNKFIYLDKGLYFNLPKYEIRNSFLLIWPIFHDPFESSLNSSSHIYLFHLYIPLTLWFIGHRFLKLEGSEKIPPLLEQGFLRSSKNIVKAAKNNKQIIQVILAFLKYCKKRY